MFGLVSKEEAEKLLERLLEYYKNLYPGVGFAKDLVELTREELADIDYTFPGEEAEATADMKMRMIASGINQGYDTPIIVLRKKDKRILLDGHRRVRVAVNQGLGWKAHEIVPDKELEFGIEKMVTCKVREKCK